MAMYPQQPMMGSANGMATGQPSVQNPQSPWGGNALGNQMMGGPGMGGAWGGMDPRMAQMAARQQADRARIMGGAAGGQMMGDRDPRSANLSGGFMPGAMGPPQANPWKMGGMGGVSAAFGQGQMGPGGMANGMGMYGGGMGGALGGQVRPSVPWMTQGPGGKRPMMAGRPGMAPPGGNMGGIDRR